MRKNGTVSKNSFVWATEFHKHWQSSLTTPSNTNTNLVCLLVLLHQDAQVVLQSFHDVSGTLVGLTKEWHLGGSVLSSESVEWREAREKLSEEQDSTSKTTLCT